MELLDVKLGPLSHSAPEDRAAELMDLQHMPLRLFFCKPEDLLENHRHVTHQIDWIIVNDDLPGEVEFFRSASLLLDRRIFYC